jgi:HSP20 family protein
MDNFLMRREPMVEFAAPIHWMDSWGRPELRLPGLAVSMDLYETESDYVAKFNLPGIKPEEINITLVGNTLTISGETEAEEKTENKNYIRREMRYGRFSRSLSVPDNVRYEDIKADYENGVLKLTVPKPEEITPRTVKVKVK